MQLFLRKKFLRSFDLLSLLTRMLIAQVECVVSKEHHKEKPLDFSRGFDVMQEWSCDGSLHCSHFFF